MNDYRVFGLKVRSEIPLPELLEDETSGEPDIAIVRGQVKAAADPCGLQVDGDALVLAVPEVAQYRVEAGRRITVEAVSGAPARNVRLFLLGSAFGALLHQRGLLPLHANAVEIEGKAVAFMGESGAGKSTLAAWFHDRGNRVLADDVCVVRFDENGRAHACAGLPRVRLWKEALEASGRQPEAYARSYVGDDTYEKFDVPLEAPRSSDLALPLQAIYLLERGAGFRVSPLAGVDAAEAVFAHTYRGAFLGQTPNVQTHWEQCLRLVREVPMYRCERVWNAGRLEEQANAILGHILGR